MDREQFDAVARLVWTKSSRRGALGALLGAALLGHAMAPTSAKLLVKPKDKRQRKRKRKQGNAGKQHPCFSGKDCQPGQGQDNSGCDFASSTRFHKLEVQGSDLSGANLTGAQFAEANLQGVDLGGACLVGANLHGAIIDNSTNLKGATFCRTLMPDGSFNDQDCGKGTRCCSTPPPICPEGGVCEGDNCTTGYNDTCSVFGFIFPNCCAPLVCTPTLGSPLFTFCVLPCSKDDTCERLVGPNSRCREDLFGCPYVKGAMCCSNP